MNKTEIKSNHKLGFIGCGKMASAIIKGILDSKFLEHENILAAEINNEIATWKKMELNIEVFTDNKIVAKNSDIIFLATKPHFIKEVLNEIKNELTKDKLVVSIAAGVSTKSIENIINKNLPVIRVMPNAPALILEGMSGIVKGKFASEKHVEFIQELLSKIGKCIVLEEDKMDILTAISGSGPAFFYKILNEMALAGEKLGLDYEKSLILAAQTAIGSAKLMLQSELSAQDLIKSVATKGGCTEIGIDFMNEQNTKNLFYNLIKKTTQKAQALG
jgi:pyrroline-5-carboxylate reductase